jgi:hypothetical protein
MRESSITRVTFREVLFDKHGNRRTIGDAASRFGKRVVDVAEIAEALENMRGEPKPLSTPRRVFISYRWGTKIENAWVADLASMLTARGCIVELDATQLTPPPSTGALVAKMVRCHVFLMVIDPGYIERVGAAENQFLERGWAYVEFRISHFLPTPLLRIGLLRAGDEIPRGMTLASETEKGNVIDARTSEKLKIALDSFFQPWPAAPSEDIRRRAELLLDGSARSALRGDAAESWRAATEVAQLIPGLVDGERFLVSSGLRTNRIPEAHTAAERLLQKEPTRLTHLNLITLTRVAIGNIVASLDFVTRIPWSADDWQRRLVAATALCAAGQRRAAVGHLQLAFMEAPLIRDAMNDWKKRLQRRPRPTGQDWREFEYGEALPITAEDFPHATPAIQVLPFDNLQLREDGAFLAPILIDVGEFPGLAITHEYDLTIFARAVLGVGDLLDATSDDGEDGSHLACDGCGHVIPFLGACHALCERCGAEHRFSDLNAIHPCNWCSGVRMTLLEPAFDDAYAGCPYCLAGRFRRLETLGNSRRKNLVCPKLLVPNWRHAEVKSGDQPWIQARARELDGRSFAVFISKAPDNVLRDLTSHAMFCPEIRIDGKASRYIPSLKHQVRADGVFVIVAETL